MTVGTYSNIILVGYARVWDDDTRRRAPAAFIGRKSWLSTFGMDL